MISNHKQRRSASLAPLFPLAILAFFLLASRAMAVAPPSFADLAEKLGPTVVNIYTTQTVKERMPHGLPFGNDMELPEQFRRFFGIPDNRGRRNQPPPPQREMKRTSLGSGVIISNDGFIITNNHVVDDADEIKVRLTNLEEYDAKLIGRDPKTDLALIKIEPKNGLPVVEFGDSEKLRVGEWVLAIGNPFGLEQTVTAGIVSAKGRTLGSTPYENFIQTDASINPGNSGGPLFDLEGRMVGINTAIYSQSGGNIGIGFAIPIKMAQNIISQLKEHGTVVRGWLGVMIQQVTPELANQFKLDRPIGALVGEVSPGSPADKGGIKEGDVIIAFDGNEVTQMSMLPSMVAQTKVGSDAKVTIIRHGKEKTLTVKIAKLKEDDTMDNGPSSEIGRKLGLNVQELTPELAKSLGLDNDSGVIIADVEPGSAAAEADIHRGDLILEINRHPIKNMADYSTALTSSKKGDSILLWIKRGDHKRFVVIAGN